ncbi:MAG TPA: TonB-dependent receptor [Thermoanaerobaculia bacterium]|nr:TonB-dependent receptor [Thermoanaerobaculia bacterium]
MLRPDRLSRALLSSCLIASFAAAPALAQELAQSCDFTGAKDLADQALFDGALKKLEPCENDPEIELSELRQVLQLEARIHLARDDREKARAAIAKLLGIWPGFEPATSDPALSRLVDEVRGEGGGALVTAASKTGEEARRTPATVVVVTAAQIERRGYLDLEELFHDLPGFDIARGNGEIYANFHPRGFRATGNDRMLLLIDGVEQNDLSSGAVHLSRQFSLLDVERVEVLYGPASALYGAHAYGGVINVVTRPSEFFLEPGESFGGRIAVTSGSLDTRAADFTLVGRHKGQSLAWSVTGRLHQSSELDLSRFGDWDFRYDVDYGEILRLTGPAARNFALTAPASPFYTVVRDASGTVIAVVPTAEGELLAAELDRRALARLPAGALSFSDESEDWSFSGKVRMNNLVLGFQAWRREEGTASAYTELARAGQGNVWTPAHTAFFIDFSLPLPKKDLLVRFAARYRQSALDGDATSTAAFRTYFSGDLDLRDLAGCDAGGQGEPCPEGRLAVERLSQLSTQVTGELSLVYDSPKKWLSAVGGADVKIGSIQSEPGSVLFQTQTPPDEHTDVGLFAQGTFNPQGERWTDLKLVAAGRLDFNRIDTLAVDKAGYGTAFSPRLAAIYDVTPRFLLKGLYSRGIREPADFERLATQDLLGGRLGPEKVDNFELGAGWHQTGGWWKDGVTVEVAAYRAEHSDLVRLLSTGECLVGKVGGECEVFSSRFRNAGSLRAQGGHFTLSAERGGLRIFGNYTYTDSRDPDPVDALGNPLVDAQGRRITERLVDLARHRANLGLNAERSRWNFDLRFNYAGARGSAGDAAEIPSYLLAHAAVSYKDLMPGMTLQVVARNLFDENFEDPGLLAGRGIAERIPQPGRTLYLRILYQRQKHHVRP